MQCAFGEQHRFKAYVHVPGTDNQRKTLTIESRDIGQAIKEVIKFEKAVKEGSQTRVKSIQEEKPKSEEKNKESIPHLLVHCSARFLAWMKNEKVPQHLQRSRSDAHIADAERAFKLLLSCLKKGGYDISTLKITEIDDEIVGIVYEHLLKEKKFGNRNFNKYFSFYGRLMSWYSDEYNVPIRDRFSKVQRKKVYKEPQAITQKEFNDLLNAITPENGIREYHTGTKPYRNFYRPYLIPAVKLGLFTGRRRNEIINLRFRDIQEDSEGFMLIRTPDLKVNNIQNRNTEEEMKFIHIPVTKELNDLLLEVGYEKYKGSDAYILAPDIINKRTRSLSDEITRGFSHFFKQISDRQGVTFKSLRKAYISSLSVYLGGNAKAITRHGNDEVIEKHYIDKKVMLKAASGFEVFSKEAVRKNDIDRIRNEHENQEHNLEK